MTAQKAGRGLRSKTAAPLSADSSTIRSESNVSAPRKAAPVLRFTAATVVCGGCILALPAIGLLVEHLAGIGGLAIFAAVFVVVLMVLAREEGLL